jgi:purine-binding chemotaxis protein CheW
VINDFDSMEELYEEEEENSLIKYLTFLLEEEEYGLEIKYVNDIIQFQKITEMPDQPDYIMGVINLRGNIIPTMDIRKRFNKEQVEYNDRTCIIVVEMKEQLVGLIVDTVSEVLAVEKDYISDAPRFNNDFHNKYISGITKNKDENEKIVILLDCQKLLKDEQIEEIKELDEQIEETKGSEEVQK